MNDLFARYTYLHQHPERSGQEAQTACYLVEELTKLGYAPVRIGKYGVYADLLVDASAPWILLRSDMDALPVTETTGVEYASVNEGVMHACGHDAHMAMLLTAAAALKGSRLPQNVRFLFQPAEEILRGATEMVDNGAIPEKCSAVFGMHVWPGVDKGMVVVKPGPLMASSTTIRIICRGVGAHCGKREQGRDALMTMARLLARTPEAEALSEGDGTVLFFGSLHSGTAHNVVSSEAVMDGTLRTYYPETRKKILAKLESLAAACAEACGTEIEVIYRAYAPAVINDESLAVQAQSLLPDAITQMEPTRISEDFSVYQQKCPGVLMWLGVGDTASLHNGNFLVPKEVLAVGVNGWVRLANHKW